MIAVNTPSLKLELLPQQFFALYALAPPSAVDPQILNQRRGILSRHQTLEGLTPRLGSAIDKAGMLSMQAPSW